MRLLLIRFTTGFSETASLSRNCIRLLTPISSDAVMNRGRHAGPDVTEKGYSEAQALQSAVQRRAYDSTSTQDTDIQAI